MLGLLAPFVPVFKMKLEIEIKTIFGSGALVITGPTDKDSDGDPEMSVSIAAPGTAFDVPPTCIEIPVSILSGAVGGITDFALNALRAKKLIPGL